MKANFYPFQDPQHPYAVAEAEIVFGDEGPLTGVKIRGFLICSDGSVQLPTELRVYDFDFERVERAVVLGLAVFPIIKRRVFAWLLGEYERATQGGVSV